MLTENQNRALSVFLVFYTIIILYRLFDQAAANYYMNDYIITEWLINYRGGFVRRGLIGEIIYQLYNHFGVSPYHFIFRFGLFIQLIIIAIFTRLFVKKGYPLLLLPLAIFLGNSIINGFWARKDNLIIFILLIVFYVFTTVKTRWLKYGLLNLLFIFGVLIHEVIFFIGMPMLIVLIVNEIKKSNLGLKIKDILMALPKACLYVLPTFVAFLLVSIYSGNEAVANDIINSWDVNAFPYPPTFYFNWGALVGLTWTSYFNFAITVKRYLVQELDVLPIIGVGIILFIIYYVLSNLDKLNFRFFKYTPRDFNRKTVRNVLMFQTVFVMFPLLLIGCDTGRWMYLWVCSTFAVLCLVPEKTLDEVFPKIFSQITDKVNMGITSVLGNAKGLVVFLALGTGLPVIFSVVDRLTDYLTRAPLYIVVKTISIFPRFILSLLGFS